jgi:hypothetical protein
MRANLCSSLPWHNEEPGSLAYGRQQDSMSCLRRPNVPAGDSIGSLLLERYRNAVILPIFSPWPVGTPMIFMVEP